MHHAIYWRGNDRPFQIKPDAGNLLLLCLQAPPRRFSLGQQRQLLRRLYRHLVVDFPQRDLLARRRQRRVLALELADILAATRQQFRRPAQSRQFGLGRFLLGFQQSDFRLDRFDLGSTDGDLCRHCRRLRLRGRQILPQFPVVNFGQLLPLFHRIAIKDKHLADDAGDESRSLDRIRPWLHPARCLKQRLFRSRLGAGFRRIHFGHQRRGRRHLLRRNQIVAVHIEKEDNKANGQHNRHQRAKPVRRRRHDRSASAGPLPQ